MKNITNRFRFAEGTIANIKVGPETHCFSDTIVPKLKLRVYPSGKKSFLLELGGNQSKTRILLAEHGKITASNVRKLAQAILQKNPIEFQGQMRDKNLGICRITLSEFLRIYRLSKSREWVPHTRYLFDQINRTYIEPRLGELFLDEVTTADIEIVFSKLSIRAPTTANRVKSNLHSVFKLAGRWHYLPGGYKNPCSGIKINNLQSPGFALNEKDISRLLEVTLNVCRRRPDVVNVVRLLLLTGCRHSEVVSLKWEDCHNSYFRLPKAKSGARNVYFGDNVRKILVAQRRIRTNDYVFRAAKRPDHHICRIDRHWGKIRKQFGMPKLRVHDLRHTYANIALKSGVSYGYVSQLLGHTHATSTEVYAHADIEMLIAPSNMLATTLWNKMGLDTWRSDRMLVPLIRVLRPLNSPKQK